MAKPTMRKQIEELERSLMLEQNYITELRAERDKFKLQCDGMHRRIADQQRDMLWLKRVIECLVAPSDDKKAF